MSSFGVQPLGTRDLMPFGLATVEFCCFFFVLFKNIFRFNFGRVFCFIKRNMSKMKRKEAAAAAAAARRRSVAIWKTTRYGDTTFSITDGYIVDHSSFFVVLVTLLFGIAPSVSLTLSFCIVSFVRFQSHRFSRHLILPLFFKWALFNFYSYSSSFVRSCPMHLLDCIALLLRDSVFGFVVLHFPIHNELLPFFILVMITPSTPLTLVPHILYHYIIYRPEWRREFLPMFEHIFETRAI